MHAESNVQTCCKHQTFTLDSSKAVKLGCHLKKIPNKRKQEKFLTLFPVVKLLFSCQYVTFRVKLHCTRIGFIRGCCQYQNVAKIAQNSKVLY